VIGQERPKQPICLVDHNQTSQMAEGVEAKMVRGVIDHHALQNGTIVTDVPIYVNIQPWGSACSIIGHMFIQEHRTPSPKVAALLLCGILSDTLNLQSPTTTEPDKLVVSFLSVLANVPDVNSLAQKMLKAKSKDLLFLSAHQLVRGDLKKFKFIQNGISYTIGFGVVETVDLDGILGRKNDLLFELRAYKAEEKVEFTYLALVDIVNLTSVLLVCSKADQALAEKAFGGKTDSSGALDMGSRVSRKKDFIPPVSDVLGSGWTPPKESLVTEKEDFGEVVVECTSVGCILTRRPSALSPEELAAIEAQRKKKNSSTSDSSHHGSTNK